MIKSTKLNYRQSFFKLQLNQKLFYLVSSIQKHLVSEKWNNGSAILGLRLSPVLGRDHPPLTYVPYTVHIHKHCYTTYICGRGGGWEGYFFIIWGGEGGRGSSHVLLFRFIDHEFLASDHMAPQPEARQDAKHAKIGQTYRHPKKG